VAPYLRAIQAPAMRLLLSRVWLCAFVWAQALGGDAPRDSGASVSTITYPGLDQAAACTDPVVAAQWLVRNSQGKSLSEYTGLCNTFIKACISVDNLPVADYWLRRAEKAGVRCDRQTYERLAAALERDGQHNKATAWAEKYNSLTGQSIGGFERMIPSGKKDAAKAPAAPAAAKAVATPKAAPKVEKKIVNAGKKVTAAAPTKPAPTKPAAKPSTPPAPVKQEKVAPKAAPPAPPAPKKVEKPAPAAAAVQELAKPAAPPAAPKVTKPAFTVEGRAPAAAAPKTTRTFRFAFPKLFGGPKKQTQLKKKRFSLKLPQLPKLPKVSLRRPSIPNHVRSAMAATAGTFGATLVASALLGILSSSLERQSAGNHAGKLARPTDFKGLDDLYGNPARTIEEESSVVQRRLQEELVQMRKAAFGQ